MPGRLTALALSLAAVAVADPAGAVLKRYGVHWTTISEFPQSNPTLNKYPPRKDGSTPVSIGIVDDAGGGNPVLKRLILVFEWEDTAHVPGLSGFMFLSRHYEEGPRKALSFTGTGGTSTTIAWGSVTGWAITGGTWCHSSPTFICSYAAGKDLTTIDPPLLSPFYDLGTWTFHGTGFTGTPYINQRTQLCHPSLCGNAQYLLRGRLSAGLVPAVPVLGVVFLGAGLLAAGTRILRRKSLPWPD